jgi:maltose 6'-phosphate phosphatase
MGLNYFSVGKYSTAGHQDKYKTIASRTPLYDFEEVLMADTLHTATKAKTKINNTEISVYAVHFPFGWRDQAHIDETTNKIVTFVEYLRQRQNEEISVIAGDFNFIPSNADSTSMYYGMFVDIGTRCNLERFRY